MILEHLPQAPHGIRVHDVRRYVDSLSTAAHHRADSACLPLRGGPAGWQYGFALLKQGQTRAVDVAGSAVLLPSSHSSPERVGHFRRHGSRSSTLFHCFFESTLAADCEHLTKEGLDRLPHPAETGHEPLSECLWKLHKQATNERGDNLQGDAE